MKQNKRIKLLTITFLITGLFAGYIVLKNTSWSTTEATKLDLAIDSTSLKKLTLIHNNQTTVLTKSETGWMVNEKYNARKNLIQLLFVGLTKSELKRPIASENKEKVITILKQNGTLVKTVDGNNTNSFYIASNDNDANSSYYMKEGDAEPYIIFVPGFSGDMANLFKMSEVNWRSKVLFNSTPISLQNISISYPSIPKSNVSIKWNTNKTFTINGVNSIDSTKVVTYLAQFEQVNVDQYIYDNKELIIKGLQKNKPQAMIQVEDLSTKGSHTLKIYGESTEPKGIYAIVEPENDLIIMKPESLFRLLVRKEFFEKKK